MGGLVLRIFVLHGLVGLLETIEPELRGHHKAYRPSCFATITFMISFVPA